MIHFVSHKYGSDIKFGHDLCNYVLTFSLTLLLVGKLKFPEKKDPSEKC